ncbi:Protein FAR-RED impared response 1 [Apostasia shenzhenica]|uniref:Protein FAR-RED impared response 1 n=1 Tax=Apostasia shenzhenica TaxID=1088818 RepID=A0A2I0ALP1_9ASPA|nr:Protein FAR-RED impared response 1 [Apostasia shenzhenica]
MSKQGIRTSDAFGYIAEQAGGLQNVGFCKRDVYIFVSWERLQRVETGDAVSLLKLFRARKIIDPFFDWEVKLDEERRLNNFLWCDGQSKLDYDAFGDVIIFDISYRMNNIILYVPLL